MKYLSQAAIIAAITFASEILKALIPLPVPASIYGLITLFLLLKTGVLKLHQVPDVGERLLELRPLLLVPASVSFVTALDIIGDLLVPVLLSGFVGTMVVMLLTGRVTQAMIRKNQKKEAGDHE